MPPAKSAKIRASAATMPMPLLLLQLLLLLLPSTADAYGSGAPAHRCSNLVPMHRVAPQSTSPPFQLLTEPKEYKAGDVVRVTLSSTDSGTFKGFAIAARRISGDTEELVGTFRESEQAQQSEWYGLAGMTNCITHRSPSSKSSVTVLWVAPAASVGDVIFTTPVVRTLRQFWSNVSSPIVKAMTASEDPAFPPLLVGEGEGDRRAGSCSVDFGCVLTPAACSLDAGCDAQLKFSAEGDGDSRVLSLELSAVGEYATVGFSDDAKMMNDLTVTCTSSDQFTIQVGYNPPNVYRNEQHRCSSLTEKRISQQAGRIRCSFKMPALVRIRTYDNARQLVNATDRQFDLSRSHFVFLAYGSTYSGTSSPGKHTELPAVSSHPVSLTSLDSVTAYRITGLRKAHGSVMLVAWFCLAPVGTIVALIFRRIFEQPIGGVQLWFHLHRIFVVSAFALSGIGVLLIFAGLDWSWAGRYATSATHGILGLSVLGLTVVQIAMGLLRPDKDAPRRWLFKLLHQTTAGVALGLADGAYITIGFLQTLPGAYRTNHLVASIAWVVFNAAFRIAVPMLVWWWDKAALSSQSRADAEAAVRFRLKILLAVYLTGVTAFGLTVFVSLMLY